MAKTGTSRDRASSVADRLHSGALRLLRRLRSSDRESGVGPARLSALSVLVMAGPQTISELAAIEDVRTPTMTRVVQGLVDQGLAARRRDADDGRVVHVRATGKGARVLQRARRRRVEHLASLIEPLTAREVATLDAAAGILQRVLSQPAGRG